MKNIIHISYFFPSYPGNFIASLSRLSKESQKQYNVFFLFPTQARNAQWLSMLSVPKDHIFFCDFSLKSLETYCKKLSRKLDSNVTIAHTHFIDFLHLAIVKRYFKNNVCHYHMAAPKNNTLKRKIRKSINNLIYAKSIIIGVSEPVTDGLRSYFKGVKSECITNAIDFDMLDSYSSNTSCNLKKDLDEFLIMIYGSDFFRKGVDLAIKAVEELNEKENLKCSLLILAHPTEKAQELSGKYIKGNARINVIDVLREIKDVYDTVDVFISPSRSEAFAYAVAESSYCKCQVIASDVPGQNTMKDIPGIIWIENENVESLKKAILIARERKNDGSSIEIKKEQKTYVRENYSIDLWVEKNIEVYKKYFD